MDDGAGVLILGLLLVAPPSPISMGAVRTRLTDSDFAALAGGGGILKCLPDRALKEQQGAAREAGKGRRN